MDTQKPSLGRIVHFVVDEHTADELNRRGDGNVTHAGDVFPGVIVGAWSDTCVNLRVFRDAASDLWITSVSLENPTVKTRCFRWPVRG